jgi:hypothetical protein
MCSKLIEADTSSFFIQSMESFTIDDADAIYEWFQDNLLKLANSDLAGDTCH